MYAPDIDKTYNIQYWKDRVDEAEQKCDSLLRQLKEQRGRLRDELAAATMQGLWSSPDMPGLLQQMADNEDVTKEEQAMELLAGIAYRQADAMLKYRNGAK